MITLFPTKFPAKRKENKQRLTCRKREKGKIRNFWAKTFVSIRKLIFFGFDKWLSTAFPEILCKTSTSSSA